MIRPNPRTSLARRLERALLLMGVAGVAGWLAFLAAATIGQSWDNWVFERQSRGEAATVAGYITEQQRRIASEIHSWLEITASPSPPPGPVRPIEPRTPTDNELIGRLAVPRLRLMTTVREGTGELTLALASGHIRGTTLPGQNGNVGVAGHRDTFFRGLAEVRAKDLIEFETTDARFVYEVVSTTVVKPENVGVLKPGLYPELTLVTCYPFDYLGSAPDRFVVKARQISQNPTRQSFAEATPEAPGEAPGEEIPTALARRTAPPGKVSFQIGKRHSQQVAPGISVGVTDIDVPARRVDGWVWVMPDRRTIWLRGQRTQDSLIFYQEGERRELLIADVTSGAASGYLLLRSPTKAAP